MLVLERVYTKSAVWVGVDAAAPLRPLSAGWMRGRHQPHEYALAPLGRTLNVTIAVDNTMDFEVGDCVAGKDWNVQMGGLVGHAWLELRDSRAWLEEVQVRQAATHTTASTDHLWYRLAPSGAAGMAASARGRCRAHRGVAPGVGEASR